MSRERRVCFYPVFTETEAQPIHLEAAAAKMSVEDLIRSKFGLDKLERATQPLPHSFTIPSRKNEASERPRPSLSALVTKDAENLVRRRIRKVLQATDSMAIARRRGLAEFLKRVDEGREVSSNIEALEQLLQVATSRVNTDFTQVACSLEPKVPSKKRAVPKS